MKWRGYMYIYTLFISSYPLYISFITIEFLTVLSLCLTILSHFSVGLCDKSQSPSQWLWSCKSYLWSSQCKSEFKPYQPKADKQSQNVTCLPMSVTWGQMNLVLMWLFSVGSKELYERACSETNKIFQIKIFQNSCI